MIDPLNLTPNAWCDSCVLFANISEFKVVQLVGIEKV